MSRSSASAHGLGPTLALLGLLARAEASEAQDKIDHWVECDGRLLDAAGVIGPEHDYWFKGECTLWRMVQPEDLDEMQDLIDAGTTWRHDKALVTFSASGRGSWMRESGEAREALEFAGSVTGKTIARGTCLKDPFLAAVPCNGLSRQTSLAGGPHLEKVTSFFAKNRFFRFGAKFPVGEAQALSQLHAGKSPPPPPPSPKSPPVVEHVALKYVLIGDEEHVVRVTLRGAKPISARLSVGRGLPRTVTLEDPRPGAGPGSAALRIPASVVRSPGVLTISLHNQHGTDRIELLACPKDGGIGPKGCPVTVKAGTTPPPTASVPPVPVLPPAGRTR